MIETRDVIKKYGDKTAVDGISLTVKKGTIHAILGPNGAGKTTFVRMLSTLTKPDTGTVEIYGHDAVKSPAAVRNHIGLVGQSASIDEELTGYENLYLIARLSGFKSDDAESRVADLLRTFDLYESRKKLAKNYSGGMRRRLDIAAGVVRIPDILFLDEPTTGLDPHSRNSLWDVIKELARNGTTIMLTTQYLEEADRLADKISVIDRGRVISQGTSDELKASVGRNILHLFGKEITEPGNREKVLKAAQMIDNRVEVKEEDHKISVPLNNAEEAVQLLTELKNGGIRPASFSLSRPDLDEVFLSLTGKTAADVEEAEGREEESLETKDYADPSTIIHDKFRRLPAGILTSKLMFGWRSLLKIKHIPEQFTDVLITPVMFTFMFTYLFGGALAGSPEEYLQFFIPGILVQTLTFNAMYAGININTDITKGVFDRFKSMPIWSPAPLAGIFIADIIRHVVSGGIVLLLGVILGFKIHAGVFPLLSAFGILMLFALSLSWAFIILGLVLRSVSAVMSLGWLILMPLVFMSNIFVDPGTMPGWLQTFISYNPVAWQTDAVRGILSGSYVAADVYLALGASAGISVVLAPVAMALYKKER